MAYDRKGSDDTDMIRRIEDRIPRARVPSTPAAGAGGGAAAVPEPAPTPAVQQWRSKFPLDTDSDEDKKKKFQWMWLNVQLKEPPALSREELQHLFTFMLPVGMTPLKGAPATTNAMDINADLFSDGICPAVAVLTPADERLVHVRVQWLDLLCTQLPGRVTEQLDTRWSLWTLAVVCVPMSAVYMLRKLVGVRVSNSRAATEERQHVVAEEECDRLLMLPGPMCGSQHIEDLLEYALSTWRDASWVEQLIVRRLLLATRARPDMLLKLLSAPAVSVLLRKAVGGVSPLKTTPQSRLLTSLQKMNQETMEILRNGPPPTSRDAVIAFALGISQLCMLVGVTTQLTVGNIAALHELEARHLFQTSVADVTSQVPAITADMVFAVCDQMSLLARCCTTAELSYAMLVREPVDLSNWRKSNEVWQRRMAPGPNFPQLRLKLFEGGRDADWASKATMLKTLGDANVGVDAELIKTVPMLSTDYRPALAVTSTIMHKCLDWLAILLSVCGGPFLASLSASTREADINRVFMFSALDCIRNCADVSELSPEEGERFLYQKAVIRCFPYDAARVVMMWLFCHRYEGTSPADLMSMPVPYIVGQDGKPMRVRPQETLRTHAFHELLEFARHNPLDRNALQDLCINSDESRYEVLSVVVPPSEGHALAFLALYEPLIGNDRRAEWMWQERVAYSAELSSLPTQLTATYATPPTTAQLFYGMLSDWCLEQVKSSIVRSAAFGNNAQRVCDALCVLHSVASDDFEVRRLQRMFLLLVRACTPQARQALKKTVVPARLFRLLLDDKDRKGLAGYVVHMLQGARGASDEMQEMQEDVVTVAEDLRRVAEDNALCALPERQATPTESYGNDVALQLDEQAAEAQEAANAEIERMQEAESVDTPVSTPVSKHGYQDDETAMYLEKWSDAAESSDMPEKEKERGTFGRGRVLRARVRRG